MRIEAPENFWHAGALPKKEASADPRNGSFPKEPVTVDLRRCKFVRPPAVLWCLVYPLLVRKIGRDCELLVPDNQGVCTYLKSLGLFQFLQNEGVKVDDRGIRRKEDPQVILPLTCFTSESDVERLAGDALEKMQKSGLGSVNLRPFVSEVFAELALNAVQHSESPIDSYGFVQFYEWAQPQFVCVVADGGIGIRKSLERNPALRDKVPYDWVAIELATRERVSGTGDPTRGIGLYGVAEDMRKPGHQLIIHSGLGMLRIDAHMQTKAWRTALFPGTLVHVAIPT
jgi:hypothetical protein